MEPIITIDSHTPVYIIVIVPIVTFYCGIFIMISNHYILKPKIQSFLYKASISSDIARQVVIDLLSSLSVMTYALSAYTMTQPNDIPFNIIAYYDLIWITICISVLLYWGIQSEKVCGIMVGKNILMLILCYINIIYHYISGTKLISMPLILISLYLINLLLNAYENKFKTFVVSLLGLSVEPEVKMLPKCTNKMPSIQYLAQTYPVQPQQVQKKMKAYSEYFQKKKKLSSKLSQQLQTKALVRSKLLQIALNISISRQKMIQQQIVNVCDYYGHLNGTVNTPSRRNSSSQSFYHLHEDTQKNKQLSHFHPKKQDENIRLLTNKIQQQHSIDKQHLDSLINEEESILFYIFPIRIFESSNIISNIFSIFINLGFGLLLDYSVNLTNTIEFCSYLNFLYALMFLPFIPKISAIEYLNTMILSSIWKFGLIGIFMSVAIGIYNENNDGVSFRWNLGRFTQYSYLINLLALIISSVVVISKKGSFKILIGFGFMFVSINAGLEYLKHRPVDG